MRERATRSERTVFQRALTDNPATSRRSKTSGRWRCSVEIRPPNAHSREPRSSIPNRRGHTTDSAAPAFKSGRPDEAFAQWKRAVELAPHDDDALYNLATELRTPDDRMRRVRTWSASSVRPRLARSRS